MISAIILTFNEEENISRCLDNLSFPNEIIVIDSYSKDNTVKICNTFSNLSLIQRAFDNHTNQWNFGVEKSNHDWILSLDADYIISRELQKEILALDMKNTKYSAFSIPFKYCVHGKPLKGSILPPRLALFNKNFCKYVQDGHTQTLQVEGKIGTINNHILHDDRKPLSRWLWAQDRYASLELEKLLLTNSKLKFADKIRKHTFFAPFLVFVYCYFYKRGFLDGKRGIFYALQRMYAEILFILKRIEKELNEKG